MVMGIKLHSQLQSLVYKKLCQTARWELSCDKNNLISLFTVDIESISSGLTMSHQVWRVPIQCMLCIVGLHYLIGYSSLIAVLVVLTFVIVQTSLIHVREDMETNLVQQKEGLTAHIKEFIVNISLLKMNGYNEHFKNKIIENYNSSPTTRLFIIFTLIQISKIILPVLVILFTFLFYYLISGPGTVSLQSGTSVLALLSMLQMLLSLAPSVVRSVVKMNQASTDIQHFLLSETLQLCENQEEDADWTMKMSNGTFSWSCKRMAPKVLTDINLTLRRGFLTMILGGPGTGKTSLISALLGELHILVGSVKWSGPRSIAYVPQTPMIVEGGVMDNVLFGEVYDTERYLKVLTLCNLTDDNNNNVIDSNSYHQINLARALYSTASTIVLDEPLVGLISTQQEQFFFEGLVLFASEEMRDVVMSTRRPELINHADQVVLLQDSTTLFIGAPTEASKLHADWLHDLSMLEDTVPPTPSRKRGYVVPEKTEKISTGKSVVYKEWLQSCSIVYLVLCSVLIASSAVLLVTLLWWLCHWLCGNQIINTDEDIVKSSPNIAPTIYTPPNFFFLIFIGIATVIVQIVSIIFLNLTVHSATNVLFVDIINSISKATVRFIKNVSSNDLLQRFRTDLELVERPMMECLCTILFILANCIACFIVQVIASPGCILAIVPLVALLSWLHLFHLSCSRELRTIRMELRSKIFSFYNESISCLTLVRAYKADHRYVSTINNSIERQGNVTMATVTTSRFFALHQDLLTVVLIGATIIATVSVSVKSEIGALSLVLIITTAQRLSSFWGYLESGDLFLQALTRCTQSAHHVPQEYDISRSEPGAQRSETLHSEPEGQWPSEGAISFQDIFASITEEPCLRNLTLEIPPGSHVGVYSSSGGGKESIVPLMFRTLFVNNGIAKIDHVDLNKVSLAQLRSSLSLVPADPPLFNGTLRYNIDPTGSFEDDEIWRALEKVQLQSFVGALPEGLSAMIEHKDISLSKCQLLYLSKALLKRSKIVLVEESKSIYSNKLLYQIISEDMRDCTVFIIVQRLSTLNTCSKLLLLDEGRVVGYGTHEELQGTDCYRHIHKYLSSN